MDQKTIKKLRIKHPCKRAGAGCKDGYNAGSPGNCCTGCMGTGVDWKAAYTDLEKLVISLGKKNEKLTAELIGIRDTIDDVVRKRRVTPGAIKVKGGKA